MTRLRRFRATSVTLPPPPPGGQFLRAAKRSHGLSRDLELARVDSIRAKGERPGIWDTGWPELVYVVSFS